MTRLIPRLLADGHLGDGHLGDGHLGDGHWSVTSQKKFYNIGARFKLTTAQLGYGGNSRINNSNNNNNNDDEDDDDKREKNVSLTAVSQQKNIGVNSIKKYYVCNWGCGID